MATKPKFRLLFAHFSLLVLEKEREELCGGFQGGFELKQPLSSPTKKKLWIKYLGILRKTSFLPLTGMFLKTPMLMIF